MPDCVRYRSFDRGVPPVRGHYSHLVVMPNGLFYVSGQKAWHLETGDLLIGDIREQTHLVFNNLEAILGAGGYGLRDLVRIQCHLADIDHYDEFNDVYTERLAEVQPARTVLGGYDLREGALVELVADGFAAR